jgi:ubiquitin-like 1-activating enzyme E1 B
MSSSEGAGVDRYEHLRLTLGEDLLAKVQRAKILVVGAGGIGCELLKNLVLSGFRDIEIVDLDTIDVSNLNRQFLFRRKHVSQSKSRVAREAVMAFNPDAKVTAHHGNVKSPEFGVRYIETFDIVMNALDNVDARRHVNRLCLAKGIPLVESGTTGYLGQVSVIKSEETECYDCQPKATQKQYPICTIRSTPDKPVHCIVWAKELYKLVFGVESESMLYEDPTGPEPSAYMAGVSDRPAEGATAEDAAAYAFSLLKGQFEDEVQKRIDTRAYKGARVEPRKPLSLESMQNLSREYAAAASRGRGGGWQKQVWGVEDCVREFSDCVVSIMCEPQRRSRVGGLEFDKDDALAMKFVTAASNLRGAVFGIEPQSFYDAKGIAGNIIPAIATTNAIIAGLQVVQALKIVEGLEPIAKACRYVYCLREPTRKGLLLQPAKLQKPNPSCFVCSAHQLDLTIDTTKATLQDLVDKVLKGRLGINEPGVSIGDSQVYEEGEGCEEKLRANLPKKLCDLPAGGIVDSSHLSIEDFSQELTVPINVYHKVLDEVEVPEGFIIGGLDRQPAPAAARPEKSSAPEGSEAEADDDSNFVSLVDPARAEKRAANRKRQRDVRDQESESEKKARAEGIIEIE